MGYEIANAWITVKPSFDGFTQEVKAQLASVEKMSSGFGSKISSGIGKTLKVGFAGAGAAAGGVLATSIAKGMGRLGALDQAQAKLEALGNSTKDVQGIMDNALASVKGTAFGIGEAAGTAATMVASGIEPGQELETVLKGVADSAAIAGVGMDEMGLIWGKVAAKGKLDGETLAQMLERQIPIYDILAEKTGHTSEEIADMVSKGKIDFQTFSEAMNDYVGGGAKRMGDTFKGSLDNMGAAMGRFGAALVGPAFAGAPAIFGAITDVFDGMNDAISPAATQIGEILTPAIENVAGKISSDLAPAIADGTGKLGELAVKVTEAAVNPDTWARLADVFGQLRDTAANLWPTFENLLTVAFDLSQSISIATWTALIGVLNALAPVLNTVVIPLLEKVSEIAKENPALVQGMVTAFVGFKVVSGLIGPVTSFVGVLKNVGGAAKFAKGLLGAGGMSGALVQLMAGAASANPIVAAIGSKVTSVVLALVKATPVLNIFKTVVTTTFSGALKVFDLFATGVAKVISLFANGLVKGVQLAVGAFKLLGAVIAANPIGAIIVGITALVAGFAWFFTQTEIGRELWATFTSFIGEQWENLKNLLAAGWEFIKVNVLDAWNAATETLSAGWDVFVELISGAWETIKNAFNIGWQFIKTTVIDSWNATVNTMSNAWQIVTTAIGAAWDFVSARLSAVWNTIKAVVINAFNNAAQNMRNIWQTVTTAMSSAWNAFKDKVSQLVETVKSRLTNMVNAFTQIPGKIKGAFANAGSWLLDAGRGIIRGLAEGIQQAAGMIENAVRAVIPDSLERYVPGLAFGGIVPAFARGGLLPTTGPGTDTVDGILGISDKGIPVARVNAGEFIVNAEATKKNLPLLAAINGGAFNNRKGDFGLPAYADGGVVSAKQLLAFAHGESVNGHRAARSLEGAPYSFGGFNWGDCSSSMGMLAQFAGGQNPLGGRYMATGDAMIKLPRARFSRGTSSGKNAFEIGFFNGGPYGGHTSGTIYDANGKATNVEMGGGRGNGQIGGSAAGSRHSQYTDRYWIGLRSAVSDLADSAKGVSSTSVGGLNLKTDSGDRTIDWGEANSLASAWDSQSQRDKKLAAWERAFGSFDQGGLLSGKGVFAKNTLSPERVLSPSQTTAFEKLPDALIRQARAIDGLTSRLEWQKVGAEIGEGLAAKGRFGQSMLASAGRGDTLRAYAASMSLGDGVGLVDRVGKLFGMDKIGSTLNPVVDAWTDMEDAAIGQVDAADAIKQAEQNLADARKDGDKEAIKQAESELEKATGVAKSAAAAVGQAQVAMALTVVETIIGLVDLLIGRISAVGEAQGKARAGIEGAFASMGKLASTIADLRHDVNALSVDWAMSMIELSNAYRDLRFVQQDSIAAQLEGAVVVAELQAEFEAQRKADMRAAAAHYDDLSLAYDAFRWAMAGANQQAMDEMAAWSDESHRIYSELLAAQVGQKLLEKQAILDNLEATWKLAEASFNLNDVTADLGVAAQKLAVASGAAFGVSEGEATVGEWYASLVAEMAELKADNAKFGTWINPANWGKNGLMGQNNRRIEQIEAELAQLEQMDEFKSLDPSVKNQVDDLVSRAGWMGFFGSGDKVSQLVSNSALGDAARALDQMDFKNQLIDIEAAQAERQRDIQKGLAEVEYLRQYSPLEAHIKALESEQASYETMAKYWETSNEDVRAALLRLAEAQEQGAKVVQITGSTVSTDDLAVALEQLGIRVEKIENPKPDATAVVEARR